MLKWIFTNIEGEKSDWYLAIVTNRGCYFPEVGFKCNEKELAGCKTSPVHTPKLMEEWKNVVLGLLDVVNTGVLNPPNHVCGTPNSQCDNLCSNFAYQCQTIAEAKRLLKEYEACK